MVTDTRRCTYSTPRDLPLFGGAATSDEPLARPDLNVTFNASAVNRPAMGRDRA
jgi:hypothetical protein